jgi:hypothetical protein
MHGLLQHVGNQALAVYTLFASHKNRDRSDVRLAWSLASASLLVGVCTRGQLALATDM